MNTLRGKTKEHTEASCPINKIAQVLSDTWTILIIRQLFMSPMRFCELERALPGISTRTLTLKLTKLTEEGVTEHSDHYYSLTKKGKELKPVIKAVEKVSADF